MLQSLKMRKGGSDFRLSNFMLIKFNFSFLSIHFTNSFLSPKNKIERENIVMNTYMYHHTFNRGIFKIREN